MPAEPSIASVTDREPDPLVRWAVVVLALLVAVVAARFVPWLAGL